MEKIVVVLFLKFKASFCICTFDLLEPTSPIITSSPKNDEVTLPLTIVSPSSLTSAYVLERLALPKNLALDLYDELISIAGGEEAYSAQSSVVSKFERQLYAQFEQVILPTIGTMNNDAQINAIGMIRSIIKQRVEEIEEGKPQTVYEPYTYFDLVKAELVPITTMEQARATGSKATIRKMEEYLQATEEYKNSIQGVNDFLMISLYPMLDQAALEAIMHGVRDNQTLSQSATEVYGQ